MAVAKSIEDIDFVKILNFFLEIPIKSVANYSFRAGILFEIF
jgi:hypothetical protein